MSKERAPWYRDGLRFACRQCGNCCTGAPGRVWFSDAELRAMSRRLGLLPFEFLARYARKLDGRFSLVEVERDGQYDCVFLRRDDDGRARCEVYDARPTQCRTWPFWPEILRSRTAWQAAAADCPGMDQDVADATEFDREEIERRRDRTPMP